MFWAYIKEKIIIWKENKIVRKKVKSNFYGNQDLRQSNFLQNKENEIS